MKQIASIFCNLSFAAQYIYKSIVFFSWKTKLFNVTLLHFAWHYFLPHGNVKMLWRRNID